jgi:hypothetical protein
VKCVRFCSIFSKLSRKSGLEKLTSAVTVEPIFQQAVMSAVCLAYLADLVTLANMDEAVVQVVHIKNFAGGNENPAVAKHREDSIHFCDC